MNILDFFKKLFNVVKKVVPTSQLVAGIELAKEAALKFTDNAQRRAWMIAQLQAKFHVPEYVARLIVELSVAHIKDEIKKGADKAEDVVGNPI